MYFMLLSDMAGSANFPARGTLFETGLLKRNMKNPDKKKVRRPAATGTNKLGVKNSLVNNINARREKGVSRSKKDSTISDKSYSKMQDNWGKKK